MSGEPIQLDSHIDYEKEKPRKNDKPEKKSMLPWLLPVLAAVGGYALLFNGSGQNIQTELTPEQREISNTVTTEVKNYISENGVPENPEDIGLPEGTSLMINEDGSWIASTPDGQIISSPDALTPR